MLALARYTLKGPYHAAAVVGLLAIMAVFFPLLSANPLLGALVAMLLTYMAGALVGLIILTQGVQSGLKAIVASVLGITLVTTVVLQTPELGISIGLAQWLPVIVLAQTLRTTNSLALTLIAGVAFGVVAIIAQFIFWPELESEWVSMIEQSVTQLQTSGDYDAVELSQNIRLMVHWLILAMAGSLYVLVMLIVLISRWMQARLNESDGFAREFGTLSLGKPAATAALLLLALSTWLKQDWLTALSILVAAAFLFQGVAIVIDRLIGKSKNKSLMFVLFIVLLLIVPHVVAITMLVGIIDNWLVFRKRGNTENTPD